MVYAWTINFHVSIQLYKTMLPTILEIKALYINYRVMYKVHHSVLPKGVILYLILSPN